MLLSLDIRTTMRGRLWSTLYAAPPLWLRVRTGHGALFPVRIVPGMMQSGVILDPLMLNLADWLRWGHGEEIDWVTAISVSPKMEWMYAPEVRVRILRDDALRPEYPPELRLTAETWGTVRTHVTGGAHRAAAPTPAISPEPVSIESDPPSRTISGAGASILVVHAPSRVRIQVPPGQHRLRGQFGLGLAARDEDCDAAIRVSIVLAEGEQQTKLFERTLDRARDDDLGVFSFDVMLEAAEPAWVWLSTAQTGGRSACAWTYWKRVRLE
jgi:hypothetical protein